MHHQPAKIQLTSQSIRQSVSQTHGKTDRQTNKQTDQRQTDRQTDRRRVASESVCLSAYQSSLVKNTKQLFKTYKQWPPFAAIILTDACPRTLSVPRSEQFSESRLFPRTNIRAYVRVKWRLLCLLSLQHAQF